MRDELDSFKRTKNAKEMRIALKSAYHLPNDYRDVAEALRDAGQENSVHFEFAVLSAWLRDNIGRLKASSRKSPIGIKFRGQINHALAPRHQHVTLSQWQQLHNDFATSTTTPGIVKEIIEILHKTPTVLADPNLRSTWNLERRRLNNRSYRFRELLAPKGTPPDYNEQPLRGDYLLFRPDRPDHVNAAFLRFYRPRDGGVRMMGLRLDTDHGSYGSKGWLTVQARGSLVTNDIVKRQLNNEEVVLDGGGSSLWFPRDDLGTRQTEGMVTEASPCLHWQAMYDRKPTFACGYLIRLVGYQLDGGNNKMPPEQRHRAIIDLQNALSDRLRLGFSATDAARLLAEHTGMNQRYFLSLWTGPRLEDPAPIYLPELKSKDGMESKSIGRPNWQLRPDDLNQL